MKNNLLKKFLSFSFGSWVSLIIGVISTPIITRLFTPKEFGKFSMFNLALNISMIFILFGTDQAFVRFFYEEKENNRVYLFKNCIKIPILIFLIIVPLSLIFKNIISFKLFDERNYIAIYFLIFGVILFLIHKYSILIIRMQQKGNLYSILQILLKLSNFIFMILFAYFLDKTYNELIYSWILSLFLVAFIGVYYSKNYWKKKKNKVLLKHSLKEIVKYSYPFLMTSMITWLFQSFDRIAIKSWNTIDELGIYTAAFKIVTILLVLQATFSTFWAPVAYKHYEEKKEDTIFFKEINDIVSLIMFGVAIGTIMFKDIIILLLGENFRSAVYIMPFLIFIPVMYTISETTALGINFKKKVKYHIFIALISSIINIFGNYMLVEQYGGKGAAFSTGISYIVFFLLRTFISEKYYKVGYSIIKMVIMIFLISFYSFLTTFYNINFIFNFIIGVFLLIILFFTYLSSIKKMLNYFKKGV